ncbi:LLM class flavin-dependent oxidoreductase [Kibdelosporangium lantanae]|uniref:LLM class flavin-dependent oxidoreductase n=1 Tax=Kibdelosporangium lantanae TaxID=1497396 RepID=A0ABW3M5J5_9PSEU
MTDPVTSVRLFTTIPAFGRLGSEYCRTVRLAGQLSEAAGFEGALIYSDNNTVDPWAVAQELISATERFKPLVAVQPAYMHPYTAAKQIASYGLLYGRRVCLNLVAGGSRKDLAALDDFTEHDERYHRLTEYAQLIRLLTAGTGPVTFDGEYYKVHNLTLFPTVPEHLRPELFISGSSEAGVLAGERLGAVPIRYPRPPHPCGQRRPARQIPPVCHQPNPPHQEEDLEPHLPNRGPEQDHQDDRDQRGTDRPRPPTLQEITDAQQGRVADRARQPVVSHRGRPWLGLREREVHALIVPLVAGTGPKPWVHLPAIAFVTWSGSCPAVLVYDGSAGSRRVSLASA